MPFFGLSLRPDLREVLSETLDSNRRFIMERISEGAELHSDELTIRDRMVVARFVDDVISAIRSGESSALRSYVESLADERVLPDGYARKLASACAAMLAEIHAHRLHDSSATEFFTLLATDTTTWFAERRAAVTSDANRRIQEPVERRDVIELLSVAMMNAFDPDLYVHGVGVARVSERIARAMGYPSSFVTFVGEAGLVHDIGKISIPLEILHKRGELTASEWETMREHAAKGYEILSTIPGLYKHATVVRAHHEWVDGSGYPDRLSRNEIPDRGAYHLGRRCVRRHDRGSPVSSRVLDRRNAHASHRSVGNALRSGAGPRTVRAGSLERSGVRPNPSGLDLLRRNQRHGEPGDR